MASLLSRKAFLTLRLFLQSRILCPSILCGLIMALTVSDQSKVYLAESFSTHSNILRKIMFSMIKIWRNVYCFSPFSLNLILISLFLENTILVSSCTLVLLYLLFYSPFFFFFWGGGVDSLFSRVKES